jgi:hypothetical protein
LSEKTERVDDRLADFTRDRRILLLSVFALVIGCVSAFVAYALVWLISVITGLAFFGRFSTELLSPERNGLGPFVIIVPAVGGLVIGLVARYGSEKIRGHGIPEALEAILFGRSRMSAKVAVLKPLSSAISIGTGGPFGAEGPIITRGDVLQAIEQGADGDTTVLDAGSRQLIVSYPDELLHEAVTKMLRNDIGRLPVVTRGDPHKLVGYLGRASVMSARLRRLEEEHVREQGLSFNAT